MEALIAINIRMIYVNDRIACNVHRYDWINTCTNITMIETTDNIQDFVFNTFMLSTPLLIFAVGTVGLI
jgi:hypothetical protein